MSEKSKIQWCDSTVNFWSGCTKVSAGCAKCYAEARDKRHMIEDVDHWGKGAPRLKGKGAVKDALAFNRKPWICNLCQVSGDGDFRGTHRHGTIIPAFHRRRIFSLSLGDWLDEEVPIEWLAEMLDTIRQCAQVTWILCTKRPENFNKLINAAIDKANSETAWWLQKWDEGKPPSNVILLASVENQEQADIRVPQLLKIPAVCRGLSLEPLLGPVQLPTHCLHTNPGDPSCCTVGSDGCFCSGIEWLIIGGESGDGARPCNVAWIRSLVKQGKAAGLATFVKQLGAHPYFDAETAPCAGPMDFDFKHPKGGDIAEWPDDLRVQEFPKL